MKSELSYLGVSHVRDMAPVSYMLPAYESLGANGIRFDLIASNYATDVASVLAGNLSLINQLLQVSPGSVFSIEGPNEVNAVSNQVTYNGASTANPYVADQIMQAVYTAVHADPALKGVPVLNLSLSNGIAGWQSYLSGMGNMSGYVDGGNYHIYPNLGAQPATVLQQMIPYAQQSAPGRPVTITEAGYFTAYQDASGWGGVDAQTQAKNTLNLLADAYKDGVQQTYLYELMEGVANPSTTDIENTFGLFHSDGTPKPAAIALHDLTTILSDPSATAQTFAAGTLPYTIANLPSTGNSLLLEKSSGAFDLMVWAEPKDWNPATETAIAVAPVASVVGLGATYQTVKIFDPLVGTAPISVLSNVSTVTLQLTDHPLIVEVEPNPAAKTYTPGSAGGTINSTGADTVLAGSGAVTVNATGPSITIQGGTGALTYTGTARATITGASGAMKLTLSGTGCAVTGGSGGMTVVDLVGGNTITGGPGNASNGITVTTTKGNDTIRTGAWTAPNFITLGSGNDNVTSNGTSTITGGTGNAAISINGWWGNVTTGTGTSTAVFNANGVVSTHGHDTITAYAPLTIDAEGPSTTVTGGSGYLWFSGAGTAAITGGSGGGNFDLTRANGDTVTTQAGATDTIWLGNGSAALTLQGTDSVHMGAGSATISARSGLDTIFQGAGSMTFLQGAATASVTTGSGPATFNILNTAAGSLTISGFTIGRDTLHIDSTSGIGIASEQIIGGSAQILFSNHTEVRLAGVTDLTQSHLFS
ncbi:MAG TPA: hypothetical protein VGC09_19950 [Rhodopila sp.]